MKNSEEMVTSLLERRDRYVAEQKKKRTIITHAVTSLCCVCLVALLGFGLQQGDMFSTMSPDEVLEDTSHVGAKESIIESTEVLSDKYVIDNKIVVHQINNISTDWSINSLKDDDFVEMGFDEMKQYYGIDFFPDIPSDIMLWEDQRIGVYKRNGGNGEVYWNSIILNFSNEDFTRNIHLGIAPNGISAFDYLYFDTTVEKSIINNVEVMIGKTESGYYYAEFLYRDIAFIIDTEGVSQNEFVEIIASILD